MPVRRSQRRTRGSHFRAWIRSPRTQTTAARQGDADGLTAVVQSYSGDLVLTVWNADGRDYYSLALCEHADGNQIGRVLAPIVQSAPINLLPDGRTMDAAPDGRYRPSAESGRRAPSWQASRERDHATREAAEAEAARIAAQRVRELRRR